MLSIFFQLFFLFLLNIIVSVLSPVRANDFLLNYNSNTFLDQVQNNDFSLFSKSKNHPLVETINDVRNDNFTNPTIQLLSKKNKSQQDWLQLARLYALQGDYIKSSYYYEKLKNFKLFSSISTERAIVMEKNGKIRESIGELNSAQMSGVKKTDHLYRKMSLALFYNKLCQTGKSEQEILQGIHDADELRSQFVKMSKMNPSQLYTMIVDQKIKKNLALKIAVSDFNFRFKQEVFNTMLKDYKKIGKFNANDLSSNFSENQIPKIQQLTIEAFQKSINKNLQILEKRILAFHASRAEIRFLAAQNLKIKKNADVNLRNIPKRSPSSNESRWKFENEIWIDEISGVVDQSKDLCSEHHAKKLAEYKY